MTTSRDIPWISIVLQAEPEFYLKSRNVIEYEFSAPGRMGNPRTHEEGLRVFRGDYQTRGPYAPEE
jgi:hypothetical protein